MVLAHNIKEGRRTRDIRITQDVTFETLLLDPNTLQGLKSSGFYKPSPVQLHGIPLGKCGFDLLLEAKSGTGKTAVFSVIALEKLDLSLGLQALILAPTREIASQVCDVIKQIGANYEGLVVEVVMGGLPVAEDVEKFKKKVHIVVGSPGRLRHLIQDKLMNVSSVRLLVLDEADKLMDKSFIADINYIFSILPHQKQVIMSSATYPDDIKTFINKYVKCAQHICPDSDCVLLGVDQKITIVKSHTNIVRQTQYRLEELLKILSTRQFKQCLIFCNFQVRVYELYKKLGREKWPVEQLCSKQEQSDRLDALKTLQEYKCRILISTDLAARGIDASNVDLVIQFEPPFDWQTYLHRMGRAGRYGSYGMCITILSEGKEEKKFMNTLESVSLDTSKISNLWSSQKIELNKNSQSGTPSCEDEINNFIPSEYEVEYKEIWKELISDFVSMEKEMVEFEALCKSFEESKLAEIESFTELLNSYEINRNNNEESCSSTYQHIKVTSTTSKHFLKLIKSLERCTINNNNNIVEPYLKATNGIIPIQEEDYKDFHYVNNVESITSNENTSYFPENVEPKICNNEVKHIHNPSQSTWSNKYEDQCAYEYDNSQSSSNRALLEAGLPLCFSGSKKSNGFRGKRSNNVSRDQVRGQTSSRENFESKKTNSKDTKSSYYKIQEAVENSNYNTKYITSKTERNKTSKINENLHKDRTDFAEYNTNQNNYVDWYNQLKARVKQIEVAIYIEEMSRF